MADSACTTRFRLWLSPVALVGVLVPHRLRADWRQEWEAELRYRERLLAEWHRLDWSHKLDYCGAAQARCGNAALLQSRRLENES